MDQALIRHVSLMLSGFPANSDPELAAMAYIASVRDVPEQYVADACDAFLRGAISRDNAAFAPSAAELAGEARRRWSRDIEFENREQRTRLQIEDRSTPLTAEELARRSAQVEEAKARLAANATGKPRRFDDLTEEQARAKLDETLASLDKTRHYEIVSPSLQEQIATAQHERTGE